jgi:hypothetical protein
MKIDGGVPFQKEKLIVINKDIEIKVRNISHKREIRFGAEDHLFDLRAYSRNNRKEPSILSVEAVIQKGLLYVVNQLRDYYKAKDNVQIYGTILQGNLLKALNTGNYNINYPANGVDVNGDERIVTSMMSMLSNYLQSFKSLSLDKTFSVQFKTLSLNHVNARKNVRKGFKNASQLVWTGMASVAADSSTKRNWLFEIPERFGENDTAFVNACFFVALAYAIELNSSEETPILEVQNMDATELNSSEETPILEVQNMDATELNISDEETPKLEVQQNTFQVMDKLHHRKKSIQQAAGIAILDRMMQFSNNYGIPYHEGPHNLEEVCPIVVERTNLQIHIFSNLLCDDKVSSYPTKYDHTRKPIFLYEFREPGTGKAHVHVIKDFVAFGKSRGGHICLACNRLYRSKEYRHVCKNEPSCFACHRWLQRPDTYINNLTKVNFCDSKLEAGTYDWKPETCSCGLVIKSESCFEAHNIVCKRGWKCAKCNSYTYAGGSVNSKKLIMENHECGLRFCKYCFKHNTAKDHQCTMRPVTFQKSWDRLAFIHFECLEPPTANSNLTPNLCILWKEENERGRFKEYIVAEDGLGLSEEVTESVMTYNYVPNDVSEAPWAPKRKVFGHYTSAPSFQPKLRGKDRHLSVAERIVLLALQDKEFEYTTVIADCNQTDTLQFILQALLNFGIMPEVITKGRSVYCIDLPSDYKLRFVQRQAFVTGSINSLLQRYDLDRLSVDGPIFFPQKWNVQSRYGYSGDCPPLKAYQCANDSEKVTSAKTKFVLERKKNNEKWCFKTELIHHAKKCIQIIAQGSMHFLTDCFELQSNLVKAMGTAKPKDTSMPYLHAFSKPFASLAGFTFAAYRLFEPLSKSICCVKNEYTGIDVNTSEPEYEYVEYFMHVNTGLTNCQTAFNHAEGQKRFPEATPDLYYYKDDHKIALFFHG